MPPKENFDGNSGFDLKSRGNLDSHTLCEFGKYDSEPFPTIGDVTYWYTRAVYWKRQCDRTAGQQHTLSFIEPATDHSGQEKINCAHVKYLLCGGSNSSGISNKIAAIKYVRDITMWGLKESKDWVDSFDVNAPLSISEIVPPPKTWTGTGWVEKKS
jgi:hypothetical protein